MPFAVLQTSAPILHVTSVSFVQASDGGAVKYVNAKLPSAGIFPSPVFPAFTGGHMSVGSHFTSQSVISALIKLKRVKLLDGTMHPNSPLTEPGCSLTVQLFRRKQSFLVGTKVQNLHSEFGVSLHCLLQSSGFGLATVLIRLSPVTHVEPVPFSPPIGHLYCIVVVLDAVVWVVLGVVLVVVVVGVGGFIGKQASDTETTREIARIENKEFIFVSMLVTRLED